MSNVETDFPRMANRAASPELPKWQFAEWDGINLLNASTEYALWSGRQAPPLVGAIVLTSGRVQHRVTVTGYKVDYGWLMLVGYRTDEPSYYGDLAGLEIAKILED